MTSGRRDHPVHRAPAAGTGAGTPDIIAGVNPPPPEPPGAVS